MSLPIKHVEGTVSWNLCFVYFESKKFVQFLCYIVCCSGVLGNQGRLNKIRSAPGALRNGLAPGDFLNLKGLENISSPPDNDGAREGGVSERAGGAYFEGMYAGGLYDGDDISANSSKYLSLRAAELLLPVPRVEPLAAPRVEPLAAPLVAPRVEPLAVPVAAPLATPVAAPLPLPLLLPLPLRFPTSTSKMLHFKFVLLMRKRAI